MPSKLSPRPFPHHFSFSSLPSNFSMDFSDFSSGKSPKRELQGPRPAPLRVHKDSHKIKKPPLAPQQQQHSHPQAHHQHRPPVIIYTVSPKIIHTSPSNFMTLVQRLTGLSSSSTSIDPSSNIIPSNDYKSGAISPAARYATIEKAKSPEGKKLQHGDIEGVEISHGVELEMMGSFPGILSPGPALLPPIPSNFFSPLSDPGPLSSFFHDLSPVLHGSKINHVEGSFMPSPSNFIYMTSPTTPSVDLFNNFFDYN